MSKSWTRLVQVMNKVWTSHEQVLYNSAASNAVKSQKTSHVQGMGEHELMIKSKTNCDKVANWWWTSHKQIVKTYERVMKKLWTRPEQVIIKQWISHEQVLSNFLNFLLSWWVVWLVVKVFADIKANSAQLSWSWGWGWAWQKYLFIHRFFFVF